MTKLSDRIKTALDEGRMLILGTQILLGFQYRAFFEKGFEALPKVSQYLEIAGLAVLLLAIALIMWPSAYHRVVRKGDDSEDVHQFATRVMDIALLPVAVALSLDFYVLTGKVWGTRAGVLIGAGIAALALAFWYGYALIERRRQRFSRIGSKEDRRPKAVKEDRGMEKTPIHQKVEQVLTESRVVLPGAQALLGFQFATILLEAFDKLPPSSKFIHMVSLGVMGITVILLMTPAAHHRMVERGEDTERFHDVATRFLLAAMITLPIGICGDVFVVVRKVTDSTPVSVAGSAAALAVFYALWFGFTLYRKRESSV